jgi:superfamily II DNA or RNA helicase
MMEILQSQNDHGSVPADIVAGDLVRVREGVWRVLDVRTFARPVARVLRLIGADALNRWQPCTLLEPFDRPRRVEAVRAPRVVSRARWMRTCAALIAAAPPAGHPATIAEAEVTLMPHQIDPVLAVLRGRASRLLLADAVGLGKTIQAALLLRELRARGCADRVLILVPSGLRDQWRQELSHRTGLRADIIDSEALGTRTRDLPPDVNPWSRPGILIVSLDFIKQPSVLHGASTILWDVLIIDEAHNLNAGTDRLAAADLLARHSRHVVLLTATPHHGSDEAFATLSRIGHIGHVGHVGANAHATASESDADPIVIFRRTRQTMGLARTRKVHVLRVTPTKQERRLHTLLARYVARVEHERIEHDIDRSIEHERVEPERVVRRPTLHEGVDSTDSARSQAATLAMSVLLKRASSSAASLERSLRRRLALIDGSAASAPDGPAQPLLPFGDEGKSDDDDLANREPLHVLGAPGLRSARIERAWLTLLIEASRNASRAESKPRTLARLLRRCREPALIYTEYRDTLTHLARTLPDGACRAMLHGGLSADARRAALARFASGDARILLTTDAAGEGLNLHHRCRLVINVELPWNPNRLEQRIGRVDRLGQTRTVHAIHLVAAGTTEEQMLTRLTGRIAQIAATLGDAPAVLRDSHENAPPDDARTAEAEADAERDAIVDSGAARVTSDGLSLDAYRSVSAAATGVTGQLQLLRAMRARAWRTGRGRQVGGPHAPRSDPLIALDERAPLIALTRRRPRRHQSCRRAERDARRPSATELPGPGLICLWRTRMHREDGRAQSRARPSSPALTVPAAIHIACEIPRFADRGTVAAFVSSTLERCRARVQSLLDIELTLARERFDATDRPRIDRLARRDDAVSAAMTALLRSRAASSGLFQPLLFEDIAREKTGLAAAAAGALDENWRSLPNAPTGAGDQARELMTWSLAMVLVLR